MIQSHIFENTHGMFTRQKNRNLRRLKGCFALFVGFCDRWQSFTTVGSWFVPQK